MYGGIEVSERLWRNPEHSYLRVLPEFIGIQDKGCSRRLQRVLCDFGCERSFAKAAEALQEHYGFTLPESRITQITHKHTAQMHNQLQSRKEPMRLPETGVEKMVAQADGSFIRIVDTEGKNRDKRKNRQIEFKEARLCAAQAWGSSQSHYECTFEDVDAAGKHWAYAAQSAGRGLNSFIHCVSDGAQWIHKQAQNYLQPDRFLVDFYHISEYLGSAQEGCSSHKRWLKTQQNRLKKNQSRKVIKELLPHLEEKHLPDEKAPVRSALRYIDNRVDQLDYKGAIEDELPIGSGLIESGHKHVLQQRLKITGAAWSIENAQNMAQARTIRANQKWNIYWNSLN